jgi:hypothetical protein
MRVVERTIATYDRWALKTFGRVGRDPARIGPFLRSLGQIWLEHPDLRFGELVCSGPYEDGVLDVIVAAAAKAPEPAKPRTIPIKTVLPVKVAKVA